MSCRLPITEGDLVKEAANNTGLLSAPEAASVSDSLGVAASLRLHWPEYLMEAGEMSLFMFCTCSFATLLQHPASPVRHFFVSSIVRRALMFTGLVARAKAVDRLDSRHTQRQSPEREPGSNQC